MPASACGWRAPGHVRYPRPVRRFATFTLCTFLSLACRADGEGGDGTGSDGEDADRTTSTTNGSNDDDASGTTGKADESGDDDADSGTDESGGSGDTGDDDECLPAPGWEVEEVASGRLHAIAVSEDDTLHFLRIQGDVPFYKRRPARGPWSSEDMGDGASGFQHWIDMATFQGDIAAIAQGVNLVERSAAGQWSTTALDSLSAGRPSIAYAPDGAIHAVAYGGQLDPPHFGRKPPGGGFEMIPLPNEMTGGAFNSISVLDDVVHVCGSVFPDVVCASSSDDYASATVLGGYEADYLGLDGHWMLTARGSIEPETVLTARRFIGGQWVQIASTTTPGFVSILHIDEDPLGNLHASGTFNLDLQQATAAVRYFGFTPEGDSEAAWLHCNAVSTDVAGLSRGTPVVSYSANDPQGPTYLATPG
jgi:hypothetical protein